MAVIYFSYVSYQTGISYNLNNTMEITAKTSKKDNQTEPPKDAIIPNNEELLDYQ